MPSLKVSSLSRLHLTFALIAFKVMFEEAIRDAEALDIEFARTGQIKGPLHGLPISFKDQCMLPEPVSS